MTSTNPATENPERNADLSAVEPNSCNPTTSSNDMAALNSSPTPSDLSLHAISSAQGELATAQQALALTPISLQTQRELIALLKRHLIELMKQVLREQDCLYNDVEVWKRLTLDDPPPIPDEIIERAYATGGRVTLEGPHIAAVRNALQVNNIDVWSCDCEEIIYEGSRSTWIVVPAQIDPTTVGLPRRKVIAEGEHTPSPQASFAMRAYKLLKDGGQPVGYEDLGNFTSDRRFVVGSYRNQVWIEREEPDWKWEPGRVGAARFRVPQG
jgi:hypothetical protein